MKSALGPFVLAIVLALVGGALWLAGRTETQLADVHKQLAMLHYADAQSEGSEVEQALGLERRVPMLGKAAETDAAFRASQATSDRLDAVRRLDNVVKGYSEVLKAPACGAGDRACDGRAMDAAFNYEYAIRTRDMLAKSRAPAARSAAKTAAAVPADESDLPVGPTLHGRPGAPPAAVDMNQFKIVIPKRGEERKDAPDAGKGGQKIRKG
jgi:hypothetical protein